MSQDNTLKTVQSVLWEKCPVSLEEIEERVFIADGQADSTRDGGARPWSRQLPLVTPDEYNSENPYRRR